MDWDQVIPHVAVSKWRSLVTNRFEFAEGAEAFLTDEEKEQVNIIKHVLLGNAENDNNVDTDGGCRGDGVFVVGNDDDSNTI